MHPYIPCILYIPCFHRNTFHAFQEGIRGDSTAETMAKLKPVSFVRTLARIAAPCGHPPLQRPTRLLGAALWARKQSHRRVDA